jgi:rhodanese-related sulfurtransferase
VPTDIERDTVRQLVEQGVRLVEVLPASDYEEAHIAGAMNLPLTTLDSDAVRRAGLRQDLPVIVYCNDYQ